MTRRRLSIIDTMPTPNLLTLPPELLLRIGSYLTKADSILISLCCTKLHTVYYIPEPLATSPKSLFWMMIVANNRKKGKEMLAKWEVRMQILPFLNHWIARVVHEAGERAIHDEGARTQEGNGRWEICTGCACYKIKTNAWRRGDEFGDVVDGSDAFGNEPGSGWEGLHVDHFCTSCCREWEDMRVSYDVGICAS